MKNACKVVLFLVLLLLFIFVLSSCSTEPKQELTKPATEWDPLFVNTLNPAPPLMHKLEGGVQNIDVASEHDGVTVHVNKH